MDKRQMPRLFFDPELKQFLGPLGEYSLPKNLPDDIKKIRVQKLFITDIYPLLLKDPLNPINYNENLLTQFLDGTK